MTFRYIFLGASAGAVRVHHKKWVWVRVRVRVKNDGSLCTLVKGLQMVTLAQLTSLQGSGLKGKLANFVGSTCLSKSCLGILHKKCLQLEKNIVQYKSSNNHVFGSYPHPHLIFKRCGWLHPRPFFGTILPNFTFVPWLEITFLPLY